MRYNNDMSLFNDNMICINMCWIIHPIYDRVYYNIVMGRLLWDR